MIEMIQGDCIEAMRGMDDASVDCVITDPPYFKVKAEWWDRQWEKPEAFLGWLDSIFEQFQRILKPNGSLYCFASPQMSARVEILAAERFTVLNRITWKKGNSTGNGMWSRLHKEDLRSFFPQTESIIFAEHQGADNAAKGEAGYGAKCDELRGFVFEPLRAYLAGEWARSGLKFSAAATVCGSVSRHFFSKSQWELPTQAKYDKLREYLHRHGDGEGNKRDGYLRREYEDLRREYEDLRRPFSVTADVPYTDVWEFVTVPPRPGKHPCEKPEEMIAHMVRCSTRPEAVVLDPFGGGGTTAAVCEKLGRSCISIEIDPKFHEMSLGRVGTADMLAELCG